MTHTVKALGRLLMSAVLLGSTMALAQDADPTQASATTDLAADQQAYCQYITEQATAQRDLLITPSAVAGVTQPNTGQPMQVVAGISSSVSNIRKAGLTMNAARQNCDLYTATTDAEQDIQYALPTLEKKALENRLALIQDAASKLDAVISDTSKMVESQNATRPMLFALQTTKIKLDADQADTQSKIAALYTPSTNAQPLKQLIAQKQKSEASNQQALDKLNRQNNWDVTLSVGAHQQINPLANSTGPYGEVTVSYNLGSHTINKHLDKAADAYTGWKNVQQNDVVRNAVVLKQQVTDGISTQTSRLTALQGEEKEIEANMQSVANADTSAAVDFRNQITSAQLLLGIEIGDASFRLAGLQDFLLSNF